MTDATGAVGTAKAAKDSQQVAPTPTKGQEQVQEIRIISLSPALTHTVISLGGERAIVGRTPWCDAPQAKVVGSLEERDLESISALKPTAIFRQSRHSDPALDSLARSVGATVHIWQLDRVADVSQSLESVAAILSQGGVTSAPAAAARIRGQFSDAVRKPVSMKEPVLFLFSVDPPAAFGTQTYVDDLWSAMGGTNALQKPGYPELTAEDVIRLAPAAIVMIGSMQMPPWVNAATRNPMHIVAPELLEPSARMLELGPQALRTIDETLSNAAGKP